MYRICFRRAFQMTLRKALATCIASIAAAGLLGCDDGGGGGAAATPPASAAVLASLKVSAPAESAPEGTQSQFTVLGTLSDGSTQDLTAKAQWQSSDRPRLR